MRAEARRCRGIPPPLGATETGSSRARLGISSVSCRSQSVAPALSTRLELTERAAGRLQKPVPRPQRRPRPARRAPREEPRGASALEDPGLVGRETCDCIAVTGCVQCDNWRCTRSRTPPAPRRPQPVRSRGTGRAAGAPGRFPPFTLNAGEGPGLCPRGRRAPLEAFGQNLRASPAVNEWGVTRGAPAGPARSCPGSAAGP